MPEGALTEIEIVEHYLLILKLHAMHKGHIEPYAVRQMQATLSPAVLQSGSLDIICPSL